MFLLLFCSDNPRTQKDSSSDWLNLIFVCDQHECWPLPSWLIFASLRRFTERSVRHWLPLWARVQGHPSATEPSKGWPCPLTASGSFLWKSGPTYTNSNRSLAGERAHPFLFTQHPCWPYFSLAITPFLAWKFCLSSDTFLAQGTGATYRAQFCKNVTRDNYRRNS